MREPGQERVRRTPRQIFVDEIDRRYEAVERALARLRQLAPRAREGAKPEEVDAVLARLDADVSATKDAFVSAEASTGFGFQA